MKLNNEAELVAAAGMERTEGFDKTHYGLIPIRLESWDGFVFINFDPDAAPLASITPGAETEMRHYLPDLDQMKLVNEVDVIVPANWKVIQENSIEGYHFDYSGPVHKQLVKLI